MTSSRTSQRFAVALEVELRDGDRWTRTRTRNASLGGLFLEQASLVAGARVEMRLHVPGQRDVVEVRGVVRWQDGGGVGVQFDGLRAKDVWALGKYFESL